MIGVRDLATLKCASRSAIAAGSLLFSIQCHATVPETLEFHQCAFEANRYMVCRIPPRGVDDALKAADRLHAGDAFGKYVVTFFQARGCEGTFDNSAYRLNGVFFSIDTRAFDQFSCSGNGEKLKFAEDKAMAFSLIQFWFDAP